MKQPNLFDVEELQEDKGAIFTDDRTHRYALWRIWDTSLPRVMYIGLNPSRANEVRSDNTVTKVKKVSEFNGYGGFYMMNLFSFVSTKPEGLATCPDPVKDNDKYLLEYAEKSANIVFCWGNFKEAEERANHVKAMFAAPLCFKQNKNGSPKHPLYCEDKTILIPYR